MERIRFSNLYNGSRGQTFFSGGTEIESSPTDPTSHQAAQEYVFDTGSGTFATLEQPPSFTRALNDGQNSYSYVL